MAELIEDASFRDEDWYADEFTDRSYTRCVFLDVDLTEALTALRPLRVIGGDWSYVALPGADLRGITVQGVRMREVDLTGAVCEDAVFTEVDLSGAQLHSARFARCDLRGSDLTALDPGATGVAGAIIDSEQSVVIAQAVGFQVR